MNRKTSVSNNTAQTKSNILKNLKPKSHYEPSRKLGNRFERWLSIHKRLLIVQVIDLCRGLLKKPGVHSAVTMNSAGFHYIDDTDTVQCDICGLKVSGWTLDMYPFTIHLQRSPQCHFVQKFLSDCSFSTLSSKNILLTLSAPSDVEKLPKRQKCDTDQTISRLGPLVEVNKLKEIRKRTFLNWPHQSSPTSAQMIEAGFFNCNVGDRVICLYCNIICQQWTPNVDEPWEIHQTLSPRCPYVRAKLAYRQSSSIFIINESTNNPRLSNSNNNDDTFRCNEIVYTTPCHPAYIDIPRRHASFATWSNENLPAVEDLVKAGFFYTGTKTIVTCYYCNGSLQNWGENDNPMIEHSRWFPHCAYAKQLCGPDLYRKIQTSKRIQKGKFFMF